MSVPPNIQELLDALRRQGVVASLDSSEGIRGVPIGLRLQDGGTLVLDGGDLIPFDGFDTDQIGLAVLDGSGIVRASWGLARRCSPLAVGNNALATPLGSVLFQTFEGQAGMAYLDGYRFYAAPARYGKSLQVVVLVTNASEERRRIQRASQVERIAEVLTSLGVVLSMHQTVQPLCVAAAHEISSAADLAAVAIWIRDPDHNRLRLTAHVGINRAGVQTLEEIEAEGGTGCIAELVGGSRQPFHHSHVGDHLMTRDLEAKICYLKPGGVSVHPLVTGDHVVGVLEMIGKESDLAFPTHFELFRTIAEHLTLAVNSATLFENLERLATHDPLTGIANHRAMQEFLHRRIAESARAKQEVGVLMIDVDHFRTFNEEEGHEAGDRALQLVAATMRDAVRQYDLAARYGGEEFTVILPGNGLDASLQAAERIREAVERVPLKTPSGRVRHVTISIGCAVFPAAGSDPTAILRAADAALYDAKRTGRNRVVAFQGTCTVEKSELALSLDEARKWVAEEDRDLAEGRLLEVEPYLHSLATVYRLSELQANVLRGIVLLAATYRQAETGHLARMESASELKPVWPSLSCLLERFDGTGPRSLKGPRIPLLARVAAVLLSLAEDHGNAFVDDPGRYDPQIVAVVSELDAAA